MIPKIVNVKYTFTDDIEIAKNWIEFLKTKEVLACDFEAAIRYTKEDIEELEKIANKEVTNAIDYISARQAQGYLKATALDHPTHVQITHFSVAWTESDSYVFIVANDEIRDLVLDFLVTTEIKQVWHNASYDFKLVYHVTGKMPKHFEDTEIYARCIFNHVETEKCKTGLKALAGAVYGDWAVAEETFCISNMYNENFLHYAAIDSCATMFVYNRLVESFEEEGVVYPTTLDEYTPWSQLPAPSPVGAEYPEAHFYHHTAKWLVRDTVRLMMNGLPIDLTKVQALEQRLTSILEDVSDRLSANPAVNKLLALQQKEAKELYATIQRSKRKGFGDFLVPFNSKNAIHRSAYMEVFADRMKLPKPKDKLPDGVSKWSMALIRKLSSTYPPLKSLIDHSVNPDSPTAVQAMELLAVNKVAAHNDKIETKIKEREIELKPFNPNSSTHVRDFFSTVGITSEKFSDKTGEPSWDRAQIERVNKTTIDEDVISFTQAMIDNSFASIVKNNFVNAFYNYTVDGKLHGGYRLLGAKSGRYTSSKPNMLNTPSTRSIFAAPVKECFMAPKGFVVAAIDYAALEDRVVANLSEDKNKLSVFTDGVDGHSLAAVFYFPDEVKELIGEISDSAEAAVKLKQLVDDGCKKAKGVRDRSKPVSFGLAYGCFPPKVAESIKIPLEQATEIFNAYHNDMYPGITKYREEYVLKTAKEQGYIHLMLGFRMYTDFPDKDIRTLNNATCQSWSILTALAINQLHSMIDKAGLQNKIWFTSTIYDSIYAIVEDNPETIKWYNDRIIPVMEKDFMEGQIVKNSADLEIGKDWNNLHTLPHNASIEEITQVLDKIRSAE